MPLSSFSRSKTGLVNWAIYALAALILFFGLYFLIFGIQLIWLGGSRYYAPCGVLLCLSGIGLFRHQPVGAWTYLLAWALTIPWTIYEVGFDFWGWLPRLFGPTLLAILVGGSLPYLIRSQQERSNA